jgi:bifunctional enzyme CysN/CysC
VVLRGPAGTDTSTLAYALERQLFDAGYAVCVVDDEQMRASVVRDVAPEQGAWDDLRRFTQMARVINQAGLICIGASRTPTASDLDTVRALIGAESFVDVYLSASRQARQGIDPGTATDSAVGADPDTSASHETRSRPDLELRTDDLSVDDCVRQLVELLKRRGAIG